MTQGSRRWASGSALLLVVACGSRAAAVGSREPAVVVVPSAAPGSASAAADDAPPPSRLDSTAPAHPREGEQISGPFGGIVCQKAAECCRKLLSAAGGPPSQLTLCEAFRNQSDAACRSVLNALSASASANGVHCY